MKALVTGGGGFIGSNLVRALLERGDDVRVLDNFSTGSRANLAGLEHDVELVEGELRSYERVHSGRARRRGRLPPGRSPLGPALGAGSARPRRAVNIEGTLNVLLAARDEGVRRIVNASSSSVYGNAGALPRVETQAPDPISPYARREARGRALLRRASAACTAMEIVVAPLLQRLRPAPGPDVAVRGRRAALHHARSRPASR